LSASRTASLALPTPFWMLPSAFSALPSACMLLSPVALPTLSLTVPVTFFADPFTSSLCMVFLLDGKEQHIGAAEVPSRWDSPRIRDGIRIVRCTIRNAALHFYP